MSVRAFSVEARFRASNSPRLSHRRSQEFVLGAMADNRGAEGAEIETPEASRVEGNGEGVSPSPVE